NEGTSGSRDCPFSPWHAKQVGTRSCSDCAQAGNPANAASMATTAVLSRFVSIVNIRDPLSSRCLRLLDPSNWDPRLCCARVECSHSEERPASPGLDRQEQ